MSSEVITKNDLKAILDEVLPPQQQQYVVDYVESSNISLNAGAYTEATITFNKVGYYPLCITGHSLQYVSGSQGRVNIYVMYPSAVTSGSMDIYYSLQNTYTSAVTLKLRVFVLWAKE